MMRRILLLAVMVCAAVQTWGYSFMAENDDGVAIYYNIISSSDRTCEVTYMSKNNVYNKYASNVVIPSSFEYDGNIYTVIGIGNSAFYGSTGLEHITIPNSISSIGDYAFRLCSSLVEITIPSSVTSIGNGAFMGCSGLVEISIPSSITSIESSTFMSCSSLMEITIPNSVTSIGKSAFLDCLSLEEIEIPNSVTSIGDYAFDNCTDLEGVTIGNSVESIGSRAFRTCTSLQNVTIGNSVTSIGRYAFYMCESLSSITSLNVVPPTCEANTFEEVPINTCTLYVPLGTKEDYSEATGWKDFYYIEEIDPSGIEALTPDGAEVVGYYTLDGKVLSAPQKGVNVVRYSDGSVKKVVVE